MGKRRHIGSLYDPRTGGQALRIENFSLPARKPYEPGRTNYFAVYWIEAGAGTYWADAAEHAFGPDSLLFFVPYQYIRFVPSRPARGAVIQFHANFLCVETFHAEVGGSGALFNDAYGVPAVALDGEAKTEIMGLVERIRREQAGRGLAYQEALLAYLKVLLILATRLKSPAPGACGAGGVDPRHPVLGELKDFIEANYRTLHAPADYAALLHMTPKTLGRIVREHLGQTLTDLIRGRILTHAKWELLHTLKPVKEIAREVGYGDELYFSRLFKKATGYSPSFFREFETEIRGGSNLSMLSADAPIQPRRGATDNANQSKSKPATGGR
jgi:AraC-like DNA-binding protein